VVGSCWKPRPSCEERRSHDQLVLRHAQAISRACSHVGVEVVNDLDWTYFIFGLIAWQLLKILWLAFERAVIEHRQKKFLKLVNVTFKDGRESVTFISLDSSDKRSMKRLEDQLREQFDLPSENQ